MKTGVIILACVLLASCGTIPHYEEKLVVSEKEVFHGHSLDEVWDGIFATIADMTYIVVNTDKDAGHIYAEGEEAYWSRSGMGAFSILIKQTNGQISVTCQVKATHMAVDPNKEIAKFFSTLHDKLSKNE